MVLALFAGQEDALAETYNFPSQDDTAATRKFDNATVRIFASETGGDQKGSGVVVDAGEGLILTAAHVIRDLQMQTWDAWVAFPEASDRHHAKVLFPKSSGSADSHDLAVLKLDVPADEANALEVQFDNIEKGQKHRITGFGRSNATPVQAEVQPSPTNDDCTYTLRAVTLYGDSGSAFVTMEGLVDGIATDGAESKGTNAMFEMKVLSLACVKEQILDAVPNGQSSKIMNIIAKGDDRALRKAFQPPPDGAGWISNLRLAKALHGWIAARQAQKKSIPGVDKRRIPETLRIIAERRLGYSLVAEFEEANAANKKEAADTLQDFGDAESARGLYAEASKAYMQARGLYANYLAALAPAPWNWAAQGVHSAEIGGAYKAAADNMLKLAQITGNQEQSNQATALAAAAVLYSPTGKLKASSWATLGAASHEAGDATVAAPAYRAALDQGATASWVFKGLEEAKSALGGNPQTSLSVEYLANKTRVIDSQM